MESGLVSIITPVYNSEKLIGETIQSVIDQTYINWEMILVDDCSPDSSNLTIKTFMAKDDRIKYIKLSTNSGAAVARNTGIEQARGQYIAFIDADDLWKPQKLERQIEFMHNNGYAFTFTGIETIFEDGAVNQSYVSPPAKMSYTDLLKNTAITCSSVVVDRQLAGDFRMPLKRKGQDTATWLMLLREHVDFAYGLKQPLVSYRKVEGSISSDKMGALKRTWDTYRNWEKLPLPSAAYYFTCYTLNAIRRRIIK